jgi:hypothetical protein
VKQIFLIARNILSLILSRVHLEAEIQRETDFLGYEAYSSLDMVTSKGLSQGKIAVIDKRAEFTVSSKKTLPLKAA